MNLAVVIDSIDRIRFFSRFTNNHISNLFGVCEHKYLAKRTSFNVFTANLNFLNLRDYLALDIDLSHTLDYHLSGKTKAKIAYLKGYVSIKKVLEHEKPDVVLIWNGYQAFAHGVNTACKELGIKTLFLEIGNIPGKIFIDPEGVNTNSKLYRNPHLLYQYKLDESEKEKWFHEYTNYLSGNAVPPQRNIEEIHIPLLERITSSPVSAFFSMLNQRNITTKMCSFKDSIWFGALPKEYVFVPLQVSTDTQLLINSDINNFQLIQKLKNHSEEDVKFVIKFHPCDEEESIKKIKLLIKDDERFVINQETTYKLINRSKSVITINSTVGLEALLLDKPVKFEGKTIFSKFTTAMAFNYAMKYLVDLDYFSNEMIEDTFIKELKNRLEKI